MMSCSLPTEDGAKHVLKTFSASQSECPFLRTGLNDDSLQFFVTVLAAKVYFRLHHQLLCKTASTPAFKKKVKFDVCFSILFLFLTAEKKNLVSVYLGYAYSLFTSPIDFE